MPEINTSMGNLNQIKNNLIGKVKDGLVSGKSPTATLSSLGDLLPSRMRFDAVQDPQRAYMFSVYIKGGITQLLGDIGIYVKTAQIPEERFDTITMYRRNTKEFYASRKMSTNNVTITFWDDEGATVDGYMRKWIKAMYQKSEDGFGRMALKKDYVADLVLELKDSTDLLVTKKVVLKNAFPIRIDNVELSYESSEPVSISVTFAFDYME